MSTFENVDSSFQKILLLSSKKIRVYFYRHNDLVFFYTERDGYTVNCALFRYNSTEDIINRLRNTYLNNTIDYIKNISTYTRYSRFNILLEGSEVPFLSYGCTFYFNLQYFYIEDTNQQTILKSLLKSQTLNWNTHLPNIVECQKIFYSPISFDWIHTKYNQNTIKYFCCIKNIYYSISISSFLNKMMCTIYSYTIDKINKREVELLDCIDTIEETVDSLNRLTCNDVTPIVLQYVGWC